MKPDYKKYKLRKVEIPEDKQRAIYETVEILMNALLRAEKENLPEAAYTFSDLIKLYIRSGYYVGF